MKKVNEANDSWDGMLPVNINKRSIPRLDLGTLYSEEDMFRVYDISVPNSLKILGDILVSGLIEHANPIAPVNAIHQVRMMFNRAGYDFDVSNDRLAMLKTMETEGYVDFPLSARFEKEIEEKLGYPLSVRIHVYPYTFITEYEKAIASQRYEGEIVPQDG